MRLFLAIRAFFRILFDRAARERIEQALRTPVACEAHAKAVESARPATVAPRGRSDSLTLLATLQREARFIDFLKESLEGFSDAQIGAAARDVHRQCGQVVERMFRIVPVATGQEGAEVEVMKGYDAGRWKLTGNVQGEPPFRGRLMHHGWEATKQELPQWSGNEASARVLAPAELEVRS